MPEPTPPDAPLRFDRQTRFAPFGPNGQERLEAARVLIVGCGALGGSAAQTLTRCGVGELVLVDRDLVETSNLPRQVLFDERHARERAPKAEAAAETLARIGGPTRVHAHVAQVDAESLPELADSADLILDGTDNIATRYVLNDFAVRESVAWIYAGVVGSEGAVLPRVPGRERAEAGACLRCLFPDPPSPTALETCETAGVILPAVAAVAALQTALALRWLARDTERQNGAERDDVFSSFYQLDPWSGAQRRTPARRDAECPCCARGEYPFLARSGQEAVVLCGRNTVQVRGPRRPDLELVAERVGSHARDVRRVASLLRFEVESLVVTLFPDGRALLEGTDDPGRARAVYDRYVGS